MVEALQSGLRHRGAGFNKAAGGLDDGYAEDADSRMGVIEHHSDLTTTSPEGQQDGKPLRAFAARKRAFLAMVARMSGLAALQVSSRGSCLSQTIGADVMPRTMPSCARSYGAKRRFRAGLGPVPSQPTAGVPVPFHFVAVYAGCCLLRRSGRRPLRPSCILDEEQSEYDLAGGPLQAHWSRVDDDQRPNDCRY